MRSAAALLIPNLGLIAIRAGDVGVGAGQDGFRPAAAAPQPSALDPSFL